MRSVLIVDDEASARRVIRLALERAGYAVEVAASGEEALLRLEEQGFDALVTDVMMPGMDGRALCQTVRKTLPDLQIAIFVITSSTEAEHRDWMRGLHDLVLLEKPISLQDLVRRIGERLDAGEGGREA